MAQIFPRFCPRCGAVTVANQRFCARCWLDMTAHVAHSNTEADLQHEQPFSSSMLHPPQALHYVSSSTPKGDILPAELHFAGR